MSDTTPCAWHGYPLSKGNPCPTCMDEFPGPVPDSASERADEIERLMGAPLSVEFPVMHDRLERLVGRPVWTHEMAYPEYLVHEVRTGIRPSVEGIIAKLPPDKPVIAVTGEEP